MIASIAFTTEEKGKIKELEIMKFYGIILVVIGHITNSWTSITTYQPPTDSFLMSLITGVVCSFHMPMFTMISGCIFGYQKVILRKQLPLRILAKKKIRRLIIPYFFFGILYVAPVMCILGLRPNYGEYVLKGIVFATDNRHLWYVLMLFWSFFLFELFDRICNRLRISNRWILLVAFVLYVLPMPSYMGLSTLNFFLWFVIGYLYVRNVKFTLSLFIFIVSLSLITTIMELSHIGLLLKVCYGMIGSLIVFFVSKYSGSITSYYFYQLVNHNSFAIYLIHPMIIYCLRPLFFQYEMSPVFVAFLIFLITMSCSILLAETFRKLHLDFVIGE